MISVYFLKEQIDIDECLKPAANQICMLLDIQNLQYMLLWDVVHVERARVRFSVERLRGISIDFDAIVSSEHYLILILFENIKRNIMKNTDYLVK